MNQTDTAAPRGGKLPALICLVLIAAYAFVSVPVQASIGRLAPQLGAVGAKVATEGVIWLYAAVVLLIALVWERRSLASIGLRTPRWSTLGFALLGLVGMMLVGGAGGFFAYRVLHAPMHADAQAGALVGASVVYALFLAVRAGVIEEILFRGLAIEQLTRLTGQRWLAALVATGVFIGIHALHFDLVQLIPIAGVSIVLTGLYLWRRDLWSNILAHIVIDAAGLVSLALKAQGAAH